MIIQSQKQRPTTKILCFKCHVIRDFTILFVFPSILRKLRLTCCTQDAGLTRALYGPDAGRVDARRGPDAGQTRADAGRRSAKLFLGGTVCR